MKEKHVDFTPTPASLAFRAWQDAGQVWHCSRVPQSAQSDPTRQDPSVSGLADPSLRGPPSSHTPFSFVAQVSVHIPGYAGGEEGGGQGGGVGGGGEGGGDGGGGEGGGTTGGRERNRVNSVFEIPGLSSTGMSEGMPKWIRFCNSWLLLSLRRPLAVASVVLIACGCSNSAWKASRA